MTSPVVVVLAYKRPVALRRLLQSLSSAEVPIGTRLLISVEGEPSPEVVDIAQSFVSQKYTTEVVFRKQRLGLLNHVIECGNFALDYGSLIMLEEDLVVDKFFYSFAQQALEHYQDEETVAGVALYGPEYNESAQTKFVPMHNGYDTYPMQVPCSWGQCWTADQWSGFKEWFVDKTEKSLEGTLFIPQNVKNWPASSWKKFFYGFMVETNKVFVYPYRSLSTNVSDAGGMHITEGTNLFQVALPSPFREKPVYSFAPVDEAEVAYDAFMEPVGEFVWKSINLKKGEVEVDLYSSKPLSLLRSKPFTLTGHNVRKPIRSFDARFQPHEMNLFIESASAGEKGFSLAESLSIRIPKRLWRRAFRWLRFFPKRLQQTIWVR